MATAHSGHPLPVHRDPVTGQIQVTLIPTEYHHSASKHYVDTVSGSAVSVITTTTGPGAIPVTSRVHRIVTTGAGDALTLAEGASQGARLTILYVAEAAGADTAVLTPQDATPDSLLAGGATITFNGIGDATELYWDTSNPPAGTTGQWYVLSGTAVVA